MLITGICFKRFKLLVLGASIVLALLILIDITGFGKDTLAVSVPLSGEPTTAGADFLKEYGWEVSPTPIEMQEVTIPAEFGRVYRVYNDLQMAQNFDLSSYKGKAVMRYTYEVYNYPDIPTGVVANLLIYKEQVIGGDICTRALDGFMHGFSLEETGALSQSFLRLDEQ